VVNAVKRQSGRMVTIVTIRQLSDNALVPVHLILSCWIMES
jgi:hypothetical protein